MTTGTLILEETKIFSIFDNLTLDILMRALFGEEQARRHITFYPTVHLDNYGRRKFSLKATSIRPGDKDFEWHFDAFIEEIGPDTGNHTPVDHPFVVGQKVRGKIDVRPIGPHLGSLYVVNTD